MDSREAHERRIGSNGFVCDDNLDFRGEFHDSPATGKLLDNVSFTTG